MLDIKYIVNNKEEVINRLNTRKSDFSGDINTLISLHEEYKKVMVEQENLQAEINSKSKLIGVYKKENKDITELLNEIDSLKSNINTTQVKEYEEKIKDMLYKIPNLPDSDTPIGNSEDDNVVVKTVGDIPNFDFEVKHHYELGEEIGGLDFKNASNISKSRFVITKGFIAKLERSIMNFMLDTHLKKEYLEVNIPVIVNENTLYCSGQLPKFGDDLFKISRTNNSEDEFKENDRDFYLIPTGEVVLANLHQGEIINGESLPFNYMAYSNCFRKEAGSAGRDTRGLVRVHQFGKVELFKYVHPNKGNEELEIMLKDASHILDLLNLPYRVLSLCTADISAGNAKTFDLEVWYPAQNRYVEVSSVSTTNDYQARRTGVRFKEDNKTVLPHLLNGSGMAVGRILAAIIENYQNEDSTITIPEVLKPYMSL